MRAMMGTPRGRWFACHIQAIETFFDEPDAYDVASNEAARWMAEGRSNEPRATTSTPSRRSSWSRIRRGAWEDAGQWFAAVIGHRWGLLAPARWRS